MTPELSDFLKEALKYLAPIGVAIIAWAIQYIKTRSDTEKRRQEEELEREKVKRVAEEQNIKNQEFIRDVALDFQKQVQTVKTQCEQEIDGLKQEIVGYKADIDGKIKEIDGLKQQVSGLTEQLEVQTKQNTTVIDQNTQLIQDNADLKQDNAELRIANETLQEQVLERDTALTHERQKNGTLQGQVADMQEQIDTLKGQVKTAETRIRELQAKVGTGSLTPPGDNPPAPDGEKPSTPNMED